MPRNGVGQSPEVTGVRAGRSHLLLDPSMDGPGAEEALGEELNQWMDRHMDSQKSETIEVKVKGTGEGQVTGFRTTLGSLSVTIHQWCDFSSLVKRPVCGHCPGRMDSAGRKPGPGLAVVVRDQDERRILGLLLK